MSCVIDITFQKAVTLTIFLMHQKRKFIWKVAFPGFWCHRFHVLVSLNIYGIYSNHVQLTWLDQNSVCFCPRKFIGSRDGCCESPEAVINGIQTTRPPRQIALSDKSPSNTSANFYEPEERAICPSWRQIALFITEDESPSLFLLETGGRIVSPT